MSWKPKNAGNVICSTYDLHSSPTYFTISSNYQRNQKLQHVSKEITIHNLLYRKQNVNIPEIRNIMLSAACFEISRIWGNNGKRNSVNPFYSYVCWSSRQLLLAGPKLANSWAIVTGLACIYEVFMKKNQPVTSAGHVFNYSWLVRSCPTHGQWSQAQLAHIQSA